MRPRKSQKITILQDIPLTEGQEDYFEYVPSTPVDMGNFGSPAFSDMAEDQAYYDKYILPFSKEIQQKLRREKRKRVAAQLNVQVDAKRQLENLIVRCAYLDDTTDSKYQEVINLCRNLLDVIGSGKRKVSRRQCNSRNLENIDKENTVTESFSNESRVQTDEKGPFILPAKKVSQKKGKRKRAKGRMLSPMEVLTNKSISETVCEIYNLSNKPKNISKESFIDSTSPEQSRSTSIIRRSLYSGHDWINSEQFQSMNEENLETRKEMLQLLS